MRKKFKLESDFLEFIELCNEKNVRYLVIGGYAVNMHGYVRYTKDIDVAIELSEENADKLLVVIDEFGFGSLGLKKADFLQKNFITQLGHEPVRIDILNDTEGVDFGDAWAARKIVKYGGTYINVIALEHLLILKSLAGRKQDLADIEKLKARNKTK